MTRNFICSFCLIIASSLSAFSSPPETKKPKLVVGIVVDQMRYDYITRYWDKFGEGGFKKLVSEGYNCSNTHYNYVPTKTAPGHASIYTGTTPAVHGIVENYWYNKKAGKVIYVAEDSTVNGIGTTSWAGRMSPVNLISTTFTDELRMASNLKSKVIGIALKDRSSIMPSGHIANAAYWFEISTGNWISSSWYRSALPDWVTNFNNRKLPAEYLKKPWTTLLPIEQYTESTSDDNPYEDIYAGETKPVFPHDFPSLGPNNYDLVRHSPYGNQLTKEFALAAMKAEELGKDDFTDILAISFSSTDEVGHQFGTHSIETEDTYLRLDIELAEMITAIENYAGKGNVLFFLTADHGASPSVKYLFDHKIPSGILNVAGIRDSLRNHLNLKFGDQKWVRILDNDQVYLDHDLLAKNKIDLNEMTAEVCRFLMQFKGIASVLTAEELRVNDFTNGIKSLVQNGFNQQRGGDVVMILEPGYIEYKTKGSDHGAGYSYDTHVPLLFYGWNITKGNCYRHINITDIAPTISQMLGIQSPSGCTGKVITEIMK